jgi:Uma2 family endonuclease
MPARPQLAPEDQMTIEEFLSFTDTRPDDEKWELIEGVPVMSPSPVSFHQLIVGNIVTHLMNHKRATGAPWLPSIGIGTLVPVSPNSLPQPDLYVHAGPGSWSSTTGDALVIFEILSRSNTKADQAWRRRVYASVPNCQHYVTVSLKAVEVTVFDRSSGWKPRVVSALTGTLDLPALGVVLPLDDLYRYTPLGPS